MKITLAQCNFIIGDFEGNLKIIKSAIEKAKADKSDLIVFSELAICGYPPHDLLEYRSFVEKGRLYIKKVAKICEGIAVIIGGPDINNSGQGKALFNTAFFCENGVIKYTVNKTLLPTYDIFDEYRYFEPNTDFNIIEYKGKKIALTICEDLWFNQPVFTDFGRNKLYKQDPMKKLGEQKPDLIINIAASPFSFRHENIKKQILTDNSTLYNIPIIYVNQIGAHTELIFDGGSLVTNSNGKILYNLSYFNEEIKTIDTETLDQTDPINQTEKDYIPKIYNALVLGIRDYFRKMGFKKATLGLSGGIDSAVTLALASEALGNENIRVLLMPSKFSSNHSVDDSVKMAEKLKVKYDIIKIHDLVKSYDKALNPVFKGLSPDIAEENVQARIRGTLLMAISNKFGYILLNTSNKSEASVGYGTLYGDMNGGLSVLGDVYKTDVYKLAAYINKKSEIIPHNILVKPPSAELRPDQKDTDSLPEYKILDEILYNYIELQEPIEDIIQKGFEENLVKWVIQKVNSNEHKRFQTPPVLRISTKAFGIGRRIPLVAKFEF